VYSKLNHPDKVVGLGEKLLAKGLAQIFADPSYGPTQILNVLYLTSVSGQLLHNPAKVEAFAVLQAARGLTEFLPQYFTRQRKPSNMSDDDWEQSRTFMESAAKKTLAIAAHWPK